jgi:flagellar protein FlaF
MEGNPMPEEIKRNLLALSLFVDRRSFEALAYPAPEKLDILININLNVASGLRGEGG